MTPEQFAALTAQLASVLAQQAALAQRLTAMERTVEEIHHHLLHSGVRVTRPV